MSRYCTAFACVRHLATPQHSLSFHAARWRACTRSACVAATPRRHFLARRFTDMPFRRQALGTRRSGTSPRSHSTGLLHCRGGKTPHHTLHAQFQHAAQNSIWPNELCDIYALATFAPNSGDTSAACALLHAAASLRGGISPSLPPPSPTCSRRPVALCLPYTVLFHTRHYLVGCGMPKTGSRTWRTRTVTRSSARHSVPRLNRRLAKHSRATSRLHRFHTLPPPGGEHLPAVGQPRGNHYIF